MEVSSRLNVRHVHLAMTMVGLGRRRDGKSGGWVMLEARFCKLLLSGKGEELFRDPLTHDASAVVRCLQSSRQEEAEQKTRQ
jgi:hypothetical protein